MNKKSYLTLALTLVLLCSCSSETNKNSGSVPFPMPPKGKTAILVTDDDANSESEKESSVASKEDAEAEIENAADATHKNNVPENEEKEERTDKDEETADNPGASEIPENNASENKQPPSAPVSEGDWNLILVNPRNELPAGFTVELTTLKNGHSIDKRAYPDLQKMMDDMRAEGLSPIICSSYRTVEKQTTLYNNKVNKLVATGLSQTDSETEAAKWVAVPGTSEHHTGLALDIVAQSYQLLDEAQEKTEEQKWLMKNSYKYGFILRYPNDKTEITGIYYEPWHYRYVGKTAAKEIFESGLTLEEYLQKR